MRASSREDVRTFYDETAESYAGLMDSEIDLPVYADLLGRLAERISCLRGPVLDTSCGPGHMLARYRERYDPARGLVGIDLSPRMVGLARGMLGGNAEVRTGDMRDLAGLDTESASAVLSFFAIHHIESEEAEVAFEEWGRVLIPGGQLVVAAWEGTGPIDYGGDSDVVAFRYTRDEVGEWALGAGFVVDRCSVEPVEGLPMEAVYLEATKEDPV